MMRLCIDDRIGGQRRYRLISPGEALMFVPDEIRKCVCFICTEKDGKIAARGTAFFLGFPDTSGQDHRWVYLVTANHVLNGIRHVQPDGRFLLRINSTNTDALWVETNVDHWKTHPDITLVDDAAVLPWAPPPEFFDYLWFPTEGSATETVVHQYRIGAGDEVFLPGLFVHHVGSGRNIPIIRVGNIAAVPDEPVQTQIGPMDAYLVEARSIGGLSGAPVFVSLDQIRVGGGLTVGGGPQAHFYLLGLMHGHYQVDVSKLAATKADALNDEAINMGIAIVLPVGRILDIINGPELNAMREKAEKESSTAKLPTMDDAGPSIAERSEFEQFEDLTRKIVSVPKKEIDEKRNKES